MTCVMRKLEKVCYTAHQVCLKTVQASKLLELQVVLQITAFVVYLVKILSCTSQGQNLFLVELH